ncbi:MAG: GGDEF domain-containing protein [Nocardioidaceae bacterium]|nr:GGDEF domain-containing protein [Nocardioidaceae bacterium]MCL2614837.1 GGDEF domain-containing protein [Nocardioidaceae bacterium]
MTLRITFAVISGCVLVLFYGVTYRSTRSAYSRWWCLSLASFMVAALLWVLDGTPLQAVANPLGNLVGVLAMAFVWAGAGSLRDRRVPCWQLLAPPLVVWLLSAIDDPAHDVWAGGAFYLLAMTVMIGLSAYELAGALRAERRRVVVRASYLFSLRSIMGVSTVIAVYYVVRTAVFIALGSQSRVFVAGFGPQVTTMLTLILLVVVTFSMSALSHEQQASELRERANTDGMTGLLNRTEFLRRAQVEIDAGTTGAHGAVVVADLDNFKELNDTFGHDAGDRALLAFAEVCRLTVGGDGLVGRLGGDEFAVLLYDDRLADHIVEEIAVRLATTPPATAQAVAPPTASFGVAPVDGSTDLGAVVTRADVALYQAKAAGRACAVRFDGRLPEHRPMPRSVAI